MFGALQEHYRETASEAVERLLKTVGGDDVDAEAIEAWAKSLARRMAHLPTVGLKGLLRYGPEGSLDAFLRGLDPERRNLLRSVVDGGGRRIEMIGGTANDTEA